MSTPEPGPGATRLADEGLYDDVAATAYRTALSILRTPADAEDVSQDACLVVFSDLQKGKVIEGLSEYTSTVAFHLAVRAKKRARARASKDFEWETPVDMDQTAESALRATGLAWKAMEKLSDAQRAAVVLSVVEGFSGQEIGRILGVSTAAAHKLIQAGREKMLDRSVDVIGDRRGKPVLCSRRPRQLWSLIAGRLAEAERGEVEAHLVECSYCQETREELIQARDLAAFGPLFPLDRVLARKDEVMRRVAGHIDIPRNPLRPRLAPRVALSVAAAAAVLAIGVGVAPRLLAPTKPPAVVAAVVSPSPAPLPSPTPPPPPPPPSGGFAYLKNGDIYYQSGWGAAPVQLTSTGGYVDDFYWTGSGTSIIYKQRAPRSQSGDLYLVDLVSHQATWSFKAGAAALAVSPDGSTYVAAIPVLGGNGYYSVRLLFGTIGSNPDPAREIDFSSGANAGLMSGYLNEYPPVNQRANFAGGPDLWWTSAGIHVEVGLGYGYDVNPSTKAVVPRQLINVFDAERAYSGPAITQIQDVYGNLQVSSGGATKTINFVSSHGPVVILSVSADESRGLATVMRSDGGHDVYLVTATGDVTPLSTDGSTLLAAWQPATTQ